MAVASLAILGAWREIVLLKQYHECCVEFIVTENITRVTLTMCRPTSVSYVAAVGGISAGFCCVMKPRNIDTTMHKYSIMFLHLMVLCLTFHYQFYVVTH